MFDVVRKMYLATFGKELKMSDIEIRRTLAMFTTLGDVLQGQHSKEDWEALLNKYMPDILSCLSTDTGDTATTGEYTLTCGGHKFHFSHSLPEHWSLRVDDHLVGSTASFSTVSSIIKRDHGITGINFLQEYYATTYSAPLDMEQDLAFSILSTHPVYGDNFKSNKPTVHSDMWLVMHMAELAEYIHDKTVQDSSSMNVYVVRIGQVYLSHINAQGKVVCTERLESAHFYFDAELPEITDLCYKHQGIILQAKLSQFTPMPFTPDKDSIVKRTRHYLSSHWCAPADDKPIEMYFNEHGWPSTLDELEKMGPDLLQTFAMQAMGG